MGVDSPVQEGQILTGPLFSEPMRVETVTPNGPAAWTLGPVGTQTEVCDYLLKSARVRFLVDALLQPMQVREPESPPYGRTGA